MSKAMIINGTMTKVKTYSLEATTNEEALHKCWAKQIVVKKVNDHLLLIDSNTLEWLWETSHIESIEKIPAGFGLQVVVVKTTNNTYVFQERM